MKKSIFAILGALFAIGGAFIGSLNKGEAPTTAAISAVVENIDVIADTVELVSSDGMEVAQVLPEKPGEAKPVDNVIEAVSIINAAGIILESVNKIKGGDQSARASPQLE